MLLFELINPYIDRYIIRIRIIYEQNFEKNERQKCELYYIMLLFNWCVPMTPS